MSSRIPVKHLTALVVDDSELLRSIYGTVLRSYAEQLEIYTASDGRKALLQLHQPIDYQRGGFGSLEQCGRISQRHGGRFELPVLRRM